MIRRSKSAYPLREQSSAGLPRPCSSYSFLPFLAGIIIFAIQPVGSAWAAGENWIAYEAKIGPSWQIYVLDPDRSGIHSITDGQSDSRSATWSPDGRRLAFVSNQDGNQEIYIMDISLGQPDSIGSDPRPDFSASRNLTGHGAEDFSPVWSPDGERIAFVSDRSGNQELYLMSYDGTNLSRLTTNDARDYSPNWSPDGKRLAFVSRRDGNYEIYAMSEDGSDQRNLTQHPAEDGRGDHSWSPDGSQIAWITDRDMNADSNWEIYLMSSDGTQAQNLTGTASEERMSNAIWSPDGKRIAFSSMRSGNSEVYVMNVQNGEVMNLSNHPGVDQNPVWAPQGDQLAFVSRRTGGDQIFIVKSDGTDLRQVTSMDAEIGKMQWQMMTRKADER